MSNCPSSRAARNATVFMIRVNSWAPWLNGVTFASRALLVGGQAQIQVEFLGGAVAQFVHLAELPAGVDVHDREGIGPGWKALRARCSRTVESLPML